MGYIALTIPKLSSDLKTKFPSSLIKVTSVSLARHPGPNLSVMSSSSITPPSTVISFFTGSGRTEMRSI